MTYSPRFASLVMGVGHYLYYVLKLNFKSYATNNILHRPKR